MSKDFRLFIIVSSLLTIMVVFAYKKKKVSVSYDKFVDKFQMLNKDLLTKENIKTRLNISFGPTEVNLLAGKKVLGYCIQPMYGKPGRIVFNKDSWEEASDLERWGLVLHEMGHCACTLEHSVEIKNLKSNFLEKILRGIGVTPGVDKQYYFENNCPNSIMFPYPPKESCLKKHIKEYEAEIKAKCKPWLLYELFKNKFS